LTICLGAIARFFIVSVPAYLIVLHAIMLGLIFLPASNWKPQDTWQFQWQSLPLYITLGITVLVTVGVSYESRSRFYGFEDQPIFISLEDWIANPPDSYIAHGPIRTRQIGVTPGDPRFDVDGWTYIQAAWVWTSGVRASQLVWFDLGTLFIW